MVDALVRIYSEEMLKAGKAADNGSLTKQQWSSVVVIFNQETSANLSKQQIQSKMAEQKKYFQQVRELVDKSGFGFMQRFASAFEDASKASLKIDHLSSAMTKAKKTETYVGASCGQKVKALQWVKDNAEIAHYMEDDDLNEFISELLSA